MAWRCSSRRQPTVHVPIYGSDEVADVTGAGDTVIATMTLAIAAGGSFYEAAHARELRRRPGGDEAWHGDGVAGRAAEAIQTQHATKNELAKKE